MACLTASWCFCREGQRGNLCKPKENYCSLMVAVIQGVQMPAAHLSKECRHLSLIDQEGVTIRWTVFTV